MTSAALPPVLEPPSTQGPADVERTGPLRITRKKLRVWGIRSALSIIDQGLTAAVGFGVNVLLARWLSPDSYGAFAVAFAGFLFISGFFNVLLLEPLTVLGPSRHAKRLQAYFREQLVIHAVLVGALSALILAAGLVLWRVIPANPLVGAVFASGLALPFLLLLWLVRRMCYVLQRPSIAVFGSVFNVSFVFAGLFILRQMNRVSPFTAFSLTGLGSLFAALLLIRQMGLSKDILATPDATSWRRALRENWIYGRWLVGSTVLYSLSSQTQMFLVAAYVGLGAAGILRAMQIPSLVLTQVIAATGLLVLPALSYDFGSGLIERMRRKARLVSFLLVAGALVFTATLAIFAGSVEHILYGGKYKAYASLIPLLTLAPAAFGASMGQSMALRASHRPHFDLFANAISAPVGVSSALLFMHWWGLAGAAASMIAGFVAYTAAAYWIYYTSSASSLRQTLSPK